MGCDNVSAERERKTTITRGYGVDRIKKGYQNSEMYENIGEPNGDMKRQSKPQKIKYPQNPLLLNSELTSRQCWSLIKGVIVYIYCRDRDPSI